MHISESRISSFQFKTIFLVLYSLLPFFGDRSINTEPWITVTIMDNIKGLSLLPQNLAEVSSRPSAEAGTNARVATYINLIFHQDTCNSHWFDMKLPNSVQVVGQNVIKTFTYGFSPSVLLPIQSDRAKSSEAQLSVIYLFWSYCDAFYKPSNHF